MNFSILFITFVKLISIARSVSGCNEKPTAAMDCEMERGLAVKHATPWDGKSRSEEGARQS
jgi:hypothetical protein